MKRELDPRAELACLCIFQCCWGLFAFAALLTYLANTFYPSDLEFMSAVKNFPSWEVLGALGATTAVAKMFGYVDVKAMPARLILVFSAFILLAASLLSQVPFDMTITGTSQARQTAVFAPLTLLVIGCFGIIWNVVWLAFHQNDTKQAI